MLVVGLAGGPSGAISASLATPPLRRLGWWSYGIYLWHLPIQYALVQTGFIVHDRAVSTIVWLPVMLGLAILAGWLSHRFVEAPLLRRIDRPERRRDTWYRRSQPGEVAGG